MSGIVLDQFPASWGSVSAGLPAGASEVLNQVGGAVGAVNPWVSIGSQLISGLLSGDSTQSGAASGAELNTSGWTVGDGSAEGGDLSASRAAGLPWYAWPAGALVAMAIIKGAR